MSVTDTLAGTDRITVRGPEAEPFDGALIGPLRPHHDIGIKSAVLDEPSLVRPGDVLLHDCQSVVVLAVNNFGRHLTVLTGAGDHIDIEGGEGEHFQRIATAAYPRSIPRGADGSDGSPARRLWDLRPGMRFVTGQTYSGGSANFRHDVIWEITAVTDDRVTWGRLGGTAWAQDRHDFQHSRNDRGEAAVNGWLPAWAVAVPNPERIKRR